MFLLHFLKEIVGGDWCAPNHFKAIQSMKVKAFLSPALQPYIFPSPTPDADPEKCLFHH